MWIGDVPTGEMRPASTLLVALVVVVAAVPVGVAATTATDGSLSATEGSVAAQVADDSTATTNATETTNGTESSPTVTPGENTSAEADSTTNDSTEIAPGAKLAGVVAVQRTEIDSEVDSRAFGQRVAAAATNQSKAAVIAENVNDSRERIETLRDRLAELERARESGQISEGRYRAQTAQLTAEINSVERRLQQANESASSVPEPVRESNGINASNIERLRTDARNLSGPETAEIAREVAGDNPGQGMGGPGGAPGRSGEAPGRSDEAPGRDGDSPGQSGDAPGEGDGPAAGDEPVAGNGSEDRPPEEAGNGDAARPDGSNSGADGDGAPGRSGDPAGDNDRREKNEARNGTDDSSADGSDGSGDSTAHDGGGGTGEGPPDGASGQGEDAPGQSGDAPGRERDA